MAKLHESGDRKLQIKVTDLLLRKLKIRAKKAGAESTSDWVRKILAAAVK